MKPAKRPSGSATDLLNNENIQTLDTQVSNTSSYKSVDEYTHAPISPSSPKPPKSFFGRQVKPKAAPIKTVGGRAPSALSENDLETPKPHYLYGDSMNASSQGSLSHGNFTTEQAGLENDLLAAPSFNQTLPLRDDPTSSNYNWKPEGLTSAPKNDFDAQIAQQLRRPSRQGFSNFLSRNRSMKADDSIPVVRKTLTPQLLQTPVEQDEAHYEEPKTAPLENARAFQDAVAFNKRRGKSSERPSEPRRDDSQIGPRSARPQDPTNVPEGPPQMEAPPLKPSTSRDGKRLMDNIKSTSTQAAMGMHKAGKGFWTKLNRPGTAPNSEKELSDLDNYVFKIIVLPLVEQTRLTRIRSRMEDAKDKTEFWMPALPYRCIDYLNMKGVEEEGLYRVSGSAREIRRWQARFDRDRDVNLLDEQDLYDLNIVASMLKAWFRDLPGEIFPKVTQAKIASAHPGAKETPQMLKDELSKLPPFNYYVLFAITCHIALLHSNSGKNKMNYQNLCICFQPCMKIDAYCFQFLVMDWRNCWQGCWTEKTFLIEEYAMIAALKRKVSGEKDSVNGKDSYKDNKDHTKETRGRSRGHDQQQSKNPPSSSNSDIASHSEHPVVQQAEARGVNNSSSRPPTAQSSSKSPPRREKSNTTTSTNSSHDVTSEGERHSDDIRTTTIYTKPTPSTPPTLSPVTTVSPMRM